MSLSIIGAGFGRTGTLSLKLALEQLGCGLCHHMDEVFANPEQLPHWVAAAEGESVDWDEVYDGYSCTVDWPGAYFWRELADHYPNSKVILTKRPAESWWESYSTTIMAFWRDMLPNVHDPIVQGVGNMALTLIGERTFGGAMDNRDTVIAAYEKHVEAVIAGLPTDRLLQFDVRDGWAPLCQFLDKPVPSNEFPRTNNSAEFWEIVKPRD